MVASRRGDTVHSVIACSVGGPKVWPSSNRRNAAAAFARKASSPRGRAQRSSMKSMVVSPRLGFARARALGRGFRRRGTRQPQGRARTPPRLARDIDAAAVVIEDLDTIHNHMYCK